MYEYVKNEKNEVVATITRPCIVLYKATGNSQKMCD